VTKCYTKNFNCLLCTLLEIQCIFPQWNGLLLTWGNGKKKRLGTYVHYKYILQGLLIIFLAYCITEYYHTWTTVVWLVLVWIGPSCPHAHTRLILSLPSAGWTVSRCLNSNSHRCCLAWLSKFRHLVQDFQLYTWTHFTMERTITQTYTYI
jgi:hypothetical protein